MNHSALIESSIGNVKINWPICPHDAYYSFGLSDGFR
jgi:hypothetical protein